MSGFIIAKISELVASGITGVQEVRKLLKSYVQQTISIELNLVPSLTYRQILLSNAL